LKGAADSRLFLFGPWHRVSVHAYVANRQVALRALKQGGNMKICTKIADMTCEAAKTNDRPAHGIDDEMEIIS
jgi:hypothetical protein